MTAPVRLAPVDRRSFVLASALLAGTAIVQRFRCPTAPTDPYAAVPALARRPPGLRNVHGRVL